MKLLIWGYFCLFGSISICSAFASSPQQIYWVRIPASQNSCEKEAGNLALRFQSMTHTENVKGVCRDTIHFQAENTNYTLYSILITFDASPFFRINKTFFGSDVDDMDSTTGRYSGSYPTYLSCMNDLPARIQEYKTHAGLDEISAYCSLADDNAKRSYVLTIDSYGVEAQRLYSFDPKFFTVSTPEMITSTSDYVQHLGGQVVQLSGSRVFYYKEQVLEIHSSLAAIVENSQDCTAQMPQVAKAFNVQSSEPNAFCQPSSDGGVYFLEVIWNGYRNLAFSTTSIDPHRYLTFSECFNDVDRVIKVYQTKGQHPTGAFCTQRGIQGNLPTYVMDVYGPDVI